MTDLSPAAQAVMTAGTMGNPNVINDPVYRQCIAAALRAAADQVEDLYCDGDVEDSPGIVFALRQLMLIAAELEGTQ